MPEQRIQVDSLAEALSRPPQGSGRRLPVRQCGDRLRLRHRGAVEIRRRGGQGADPDDGAAREPRGGDGAWLFPRHRQAAGGDGACQCGDRQRDLRHHQRGARERADHLHLRPHAADRDRRAGRALDLHPLGPGDVRPGRHGPRDGQVGLRAAQRAPAGDRRRPRGERGDERAARAGLSHLAARGAGREAGRVRLSEPVAPARRVEPGARSRRDRQGRRVDPGGREPAGHHRERRPESGLGRGADRARRALRPAGGHLPAALRLAPHRPSDAYGVRAGRAGRRGRPDPWWSIATCPGSRACTAPTPTPG